MRRLFYAIAAVLFSIFVLPVSTQAQIVSVNDGKSCETAFIVDTAFTGVFTAGDYWFMSETAMLPIFLYVYPQEESTKAPEVQFDFTCTEGVYDDPDVAKLVDLAAEYKLTLPMHNTLTQGYDADGNRPYMISFNQNYRDLLYNNGVSYSIPAYLRLRLYSTSRVKIVSRSMFSMCRDFTNTLSLNTTLLFEPIDSVNTYVWPIGEWINERYMFVWRGEKKLSMYVGKNCRIDRSNYVRNYFILPDHENNTKMTPARAKEWIKDVNQTDLYVRLFAEGEGTLTLETYSEDVDITDYIIMGQSAIIDREKMTISAILPYGTSQDDMYDAMDDALKDMIANKRYTAFNGEKPKYGKKYATLSIGDKTYTMVITIAQKSGSTISTLNNITIDGVQLLGFKTNILEYLDVEVSNTEANIKAIPTDDKAKVEIDAFNSIPSVIKITVTAEAGNQMIYTLHLIKSRSKNTRLLSLMVDGVSVPNFSPSTLYYKMTVNKLPVVTAEAEDSKSTVEIGQAKNVPGFAQIFVTAESGDREIYTIKFSLAQEVLSCNQTAILAQLGRSYQISPNEDIVIGCPARDWSGQNICITWTGQKDMEVYVGSSCLFTTNTNDESVIAHYTLKQPKWTKERRYFFGVNELATLVRKTVDNNIYLRFKTTETANIILSTYIPTCNNRASMIDIPSVQNTQSSVDIPQNAFSTIYSFYLPEWQKKDVKITWTGASTLELFIADTCDFLLQQTNTHLLAEGYKVLSPGQSFVITQGVAQGWLQRVGDMAYMRVLNGAQGTLSFTIEKDYSGGTPPVETTEHKLTLLSSPADAGTFKAALAGEDLSAGDGTGVFSFEENKTVSFSAVANEHYTFRSWADGNAQNPRTVNMNTDKEYTALFVVNKYTLTVTCNQQQGRVSGSGRYNYLTEVPVEARANRGYKFSSWSDGSTDNPHTITIEGDTEIEALFVVDDTAVDDLSNDHGTTDRPRKVVRDNQLLILMPDGTVMNMLGERVQ